MIKIWKICRWISSAKIIPTADLPGWIMFIKAFLKYEKWKFAEDDQNFSSSGPLNQGNTIGINKDGIVFYMDQISRKKYRPKFEKDNYFLYKIPFESPFFLLKNNIFFINFFI